jgi:hypothetical protein
MAVILTLILMAFYYIWRVAYITPWYDELYTYYYFISRGPIYAAIHWPLPNNHVGYSVLSAILDLFGNSYIGLRGISFVCAVLNPYIVYRICRRFVSNWISYGAMLLYFSCLLVNDLSVQGRGYTLATTCFLFCIRQIIVICKSENIVRMDFVKFAITLILGLYTIPSSIYWVIPTCFATGLFLVINGIRSNDVKGKKWNNRYYKKLRSFITAGLFAAAIAFILYAVIWLAIGSNLLVKDDTSVFFGMSHVKLILSHPFKAAFKGIEYMLSQPYIQSVPRHGYLGQLVEWLQTLSSYMYPVSPFVTALVVFMGLIILGVECIRHFENSRTIFSLLIIMNANGFLILLILQAKLPYYRVFSYLGFITAACAAVMVEHLYLRINEIFKDKLKSLVIYEILPVIPVILMAVFSVMMFLNTSYFAQLGDRETSCYNALYVMNPSEQRKLCVFDCDQEYLLKFGWDIDCTNTDPMDCDYVLVDRNMMKEGYNGYDNWKFYQTYETIPWDYINSEFYIFYENEDFVLYKR